MPAGRPPLEITITDLNRIEEMAGYGLTHEQIATIIGVSASFLRNDPEILARLRLGKAEAILKGSRKAFKVGVEGDNHDMLKFWLRCIAKWREVDPNINVGGMNLVLTPENYGKLKEAAKRYLSRQRGLAGNGNG